MLDLIPQTSIPVFSLERFAFLEKINPYLLIGVLVALGIWSFVWKGIALWHAAKNRQKKWFIVLLILNTVGVLEMLYLLAFTPAPQEDEREEERVHRI